MLNTLTYCFRRILGIFSGGNLKIKQSSWEVTDEIHTANSIGLIMRATSSIVIKIGFDMIPVQLRDTLIVPITPTDVRFQNKKNR